MEARFWGFLSKKKHFFLELWYKLATVRYKVSITWYKKMLNLQMFQLSRKKDWVYIIYISKFWEKNLNCDMQMCIFGNKIWMASFYLTILTISRNCEFVSHYSGFITHNFEFISCYSEKINAELGD